MNDLQDSSVSWEDRILNGKRKMDSLKNNLTIDGTDYIVKITSENLMAGFNYVCFSRFQTGYYGFLHGANNVDVLAKKKLCFLTYFVKNKILIAKFAN